MLPTCLANRTVNGVFTSVSTRARSQGIDQGTPYTFLVSPANNTYVMTVPGVTTYGEYSWSLADNFRASAGGGQSTSTSVLGLVPTSRSMGSTLSEVTGEDVSGMVVATDRNVASFSSPLGIATFNIVPLVASASAPGSRFRR
jgi:hypothetical protein